MIATVPFTAKTGSTEIASVLIPDTEHTVDVSIPFWTDPTLVIGMTCDASFDAGTTWITLGVARPSPGGPANPRSSKFGFVFTTLSMVCELCGGLYLSGDDRYERALSHSTIELAPGWTMDEVHARLPEADQDTDVQDFKLRIAFDAEGNDIDDEVFVRTFHTPTPVLPADRLVRVTIESNRDLASELTVESY